MATIKPLFDDLPLVKKGPLGNAWGRFGSTDELGMLNLLTPATTVTAAAEIKDGVRVSTDWPLDRISYPMFGRPGFRQDIKNKAPRTVNDDTLTFNTQVSSQWDGFRHYGYQKERLHFNGYTPADIAHTKKLGIHIWAEHGGIVGRGVLLDYAGWAAVNGRSPSCFETTSISLADLKAVVASQGTQLRQGDVLFIRSGWTRAYNALSESECQELAERASPPAIGVHSSEDVLRWLWDEGFSAVAGDMPSFEAWPCTDTRFWLHEWLLAGWGVPIGELFDLEQLSKECRKRNRWSFFFSSMPLKVPGGVASPPNGVAIF